MPSIPINIAVSAEKVESHGILDWSKYDSID